MNYQPLSWIYLSGIVAMLSMVIYIELRSRKASQDTQSHRFRYYFAVVCNVTYIVIGAYVLHLIERAKLHKGDPYALLFGAAMLTMALLASFVFTVWNVLDDPSSPNDRPEEEERYRTRGRDSRGRHAR